MMFSLPAVIILLVFSAQSQCQDTESPIVFYPIEQTPYMIYLNREKETSQLTIKGQGVNFDSNKFMTKLPRGEFKKGEMIVEQKVSLAPPFPIHPTFIVRSPDFNTNFTKFDGNIRIDINWDKDYFSFKRSKDFKYELKFFNFKGDLLGGAIFPNQTGEAGYVLSFKANRSDQEYSACSQDNQTHDIMFALIRTVGDRKTEVSAWSFHVVYPRRVISSEMMQQADWELEEVVKQQSAFVAISLLENEFKDWEHDSFNFGVLTFLTRAAALSKSDFDKYLPDVKYQEPQGSEYTLKDVGQRTGAGFGLLHWDSEGYHFSRKFYQHFVDPKTRMIDVALFEAFAVVCFDWKNILETRSPEDSRDPKTAIPYRNLPGNDQWYYQLGSGKKTFHGSRFIRNENVEQMEFTWYFNCKSWKTDANGYLKKINKNVTINQG